LKVEVAQKDGGDGDAHHQWSKLQVAPRWDGGDGDAHYQWSKVSPAREYGGDHGHDDRQL
jgi:hypothetical protein